jgi:hypothetical protein
MYGDGTATIRRLRLSGKARKWFLVVHVIASALWFGVDIALGTLVLTAFLTDDPHTAGTALQALRYFAIWPMFGASLVSLASGVVLGLGSRYGLLRYWWVVVKLAANVLMSCLIVAALRPGVDAAAGVGRRLVAGEGGDLAPDLLFPVFVAPALLLTAYLLSVFKPQARTRGKTSLVEHPDSQSEEADGDTRRDGQPDRRQAAVAS